jgi:DNA-directed RNA polymerase specialized sigma subunit
MKALNENCQQMAIHGVTLSGPPKGGKIPDPVYSAYLETEKLTHQYQDEIKATALEIIQLMDKKNKMDNALNSLRPHERSIVELRFMRRLPWSRIADMTVYSDRQCRTIKDKAIDMIIHNMQ